jgi:MscS family membrane protein
MREILTKTYFDNTVLQWLLAFAVIVGALVLGRVLYWLIGRTIKRMATRTQTQLDDILVDMLEEPIVAAVVIGGIWYGLRLLDMSTKARDYVDRGVLALLILNGAWLLARVVAALMKQYLVPLAHKTESDLDDHLVAIISKGVQGSIWTIGIIMALASAEIDVLSLLAGLGIGGLAFALAAQHSVGNFFGSLAIFFDKPFRVGDRVRVRGYDGVVEAVGLRTTRIRTRYEGRIVALPNQAVAESEIVNVDSERGRQIFAVYRLTPQMEDEQIVLALDTLKNIAESDPDTQDKVVTGFLAITEYSRDIMLLYWIKPEASNLKTRTRINLEIVRQFREKDIQFVKAKPVHQKWDTSRWSDGPSSYSSA